MKKMIVFMLLLAFVAGFQVTVLANNGEIQNPSEWCTAKEDLGLRNHGACVSYLRACEGPGNTQPLCACKELLNVDPESFFDGYNNLGECVSHLRNGFVSE